MGGSPRMSDSRKEGLPTCRRHRTTTASLGGNCLPCATTAYCGEALIATSIGRIGQNTSDRRRQCGAWLRALTSGSSGLRQAGKRKSLNICLR